MEKGTLTVVARIKAKAGMEERVREELMALVAPTHAEPGCVNYDLHQSIDKPAEFLFHENWVSKQDLDDHLKTPHLQSFLGKAEEILAEPVDITLWNMISQPKQRFKSPFEDSHPQSVPQQKPLPQGIIECSQLCAIWISSFSLGCSCCSAPAVNRFARAPHRVAWLLRIELYGRRNGLL
jgi:quinol monooxygenase YgiN